MTKDTIMTIVQAIFVAGTMGEWFYLVNEHIVKPEGLEMFLAGAGTGYLAYFFHVKGKTP